ncbi:MAG: hypothetical protein WCJ23_04985, partial [Verrucomicrobiota bacterium]
MSRSFFYRGGTWVRRLGGRVRSWGGVGVRILGGAAMLWMSMVPATLRATPQGEVVVGVAAG